MNIEALKFPIGEYVAPNNIDQKQINEWISEIESFPKRLAILTNDLSKAELNLVYRPEGWNIKQVVHHCADSHMNAMIRFKLTLTEDSPTIRPYFEDRWAILPDSLDDDLSASIQILTGLHKKWGNVMRNLSTEELKREFIHPEHGQRFSLAETVGTYAWHSNHHLAHIEQALSYKGQF
ncbi:MAG: putative metal-dependent hydrolase [Crocinitomix sp.]|nr:putative metal-dependent hydrolase [Crocinitomix sp.]